MRVGIVSDTHDRITSVKTAVALLRERGVGCSVHCIPLHTMHYYQRMYGYRDGNFPISEDIFSRCLSLPIYAAMTDDDVAYVIETVRAIARENRR